MGALYLSCSLCGRRQPGGLISSAAWGRVDPANGDGPSKLACPTCVERTPDWREQLARPAQAS